MSHLLARAAPALLLALALALLPSPGFAEDYPADAPEGTEAVADPDVGADLEAPDPLFDEEFDDGDYSNADPWERGNRVSFGLNQTLDTFLFEPITTGYQFIMPEPGRRAVRRVFLNFDSPSVFVNSVLQGRLRDAAATAGRFALNVTLGWGGLFDAGQAAGWEPRHADFGQTLALVGVGSGPYVVIPLFGPSTVRDGLGDLVDRAFQPLTYILGPMPNLLIGGGYGLSLREENADALEALEESSVDFYSVLRSAYLQNRKAEIWGNNGALSPEPAVEAEPLELLESDDDALAGAL